MRQSVVLGQIADVDVRLLRIFRCVAEAGGISAAELELNISRSTISRHIADLEVRLGFTLCRRGRAGFSLTDEGRVAYDAALRLLAALNEFRAEINDVRSQMTGQLVLALFDKTVTNRECKIYQAIRNFETVAPDVGIEIYIKPLNDIEKAVMDGTHHIGVIPEHRPSASLLYHRLFNEKMILYCGRDHPLFERESSSITEADIRSSKYAGLGYHSPNMEHDRELGMQRTAIAYDQEGIVTLLLSGVYLAYLPEHYARSFVAEGLIRSIDVSPYHYNCQYSAIVRRSPKPSRIIETFLSALNQAHKEMEKQ